MTVRGGELIYYYHHHHRHFYSCVHLHTEVSRRAALVQRHPSTPTYHFISFYFVRRPIERLARVYIYTREVVRRTTSVRRHSLPPSATPSHTSIDTKSVPEDTDRPTDRPTIVEIESRNSIHCVNIISLRVILNTFVHHNHHHIVVRARNPKSGDQKIVLFSSAIRAPDLWRRARNARCDRVRHKRRRRRLSRHRTIKIYSTSSHHNNAYRGNEHKNYAQVTPDTASVADARLTCPLGMLKPHDGVSLLI